MMINGESTWLESETGAQSYGSELLSSSVNEISDIADSKQVSTSVIDELKNIINSCLPLTITFFLQYSFSLVSIFTVSKIGKTELAAVSLASMTFNITSSIFVGMATCLETLCSQAYGAKNYKLVGLYFQKCFMLISVFNLPLLAVWWNSAYFLNFIVTDPRLSLLAQSYLRIMSFATPAYIFFETAKRYLQSQKIFVAGQYVLFIVAPLNIVFNYVFVWSKTFGMGFIGAPIAAASCYILSALLLLIYMTFIDGYQCWFGFQFGESFKNWSLILPLALNGVSMVLTEFIAFEILTLSAATFGVSTLAAQSICSTIAELCFQIPFAISVAASTRIGGLLGAGLKENAIIATKATYIISIFSSLINFGIMIFARFKIIYLFTEDPKVLKVVRIILSVISVNQLWDCPNIIGAGILRAQGRQRVGGVLNLIIYYGVAVPLALYLGFVCDFNVKGLWIGLGVGILLLASSEFTLILFSDWDQILKNAIKHSS